MMFWEYLFIDATLGKTLKSPDVGYYMRNKNDSRSMGRSHLQLKILSPFVLEPWFRTEPKRGSEKGLIDIFLGMQDIRYTQRVGFWFPCGFDAITICIEMGY